MTKRIMGIMLAILMLSLAACGSDTQTDTTTAAPVSQGEVGEPVSGSFESFTSSDLTGATVTQSIFSGKKLTMINMWATFCSPCIGEMPDLAALNTEYSEKGFQVVGIVCDTVDSYGVPSTAAIAQALTIVAQTGANYRHMVPSDSLNTIILSDVAVVPTTVFVDGSGKIVGQTYTGSRSKDEWAQIIDSLLKTV